VKRRRALAFESLDARVVLSGGSLLGSGSLPDIGPLDAQVRHAGPAPGGIARFSTPDNPDSAKSSPGALRPGHDDFGRLSGFDGGRGGGALAGGGPFVGGFRAPTVFDVLGPGSGAPVLVLSSAGWNGMTARDVVTTLLLVDLLGWSNSYTPTPGPPPLSAATSLPAPHGLGGAPEAAANSSSLVAKTNDPEMDGVAKVAALGRLTSPNISTSDFAALTGVSTAVSLPATFESRVSPAAALSARVGQLPSYVVQDDDGLAVKGDEFSNSDRAPGAARFDGEGGFVELSPRGDLLPLSRILKTDDKLSGLSRHRDLTDDEAFWDEVLEGLDQLLNDSEDEQPLAKPRKHEQAERGARRQDHVEPELPSPVVPAALFDDGGLIALQPSGTKQLAAPAIDAVPSMDPIHVTMDASVALFQAFERSDGPVKTATPAATSSDESDRPPGSDLNASAEESPDSSGKVAAGVGLGLLVAWPWMRRREQSRDERS
jgi:hypothetical protein